MGKHMNVRPFARQPALLLVAGAVGAACGTPTAAGAARLSQTAFAALAAKCAPAVPITTIRAVAQTESGLNPWALHDNTTGITAKPTSFEAALSEATRWIGEGHSVDLGLMQINSANLGALDMTARSALDPCASLAGGAAVLRAAYEGGKTSADQQAALLMALSLYNTGSPFKGIMNGYAHKVLAAVREEELPPPSHTTGPEAPAAPDVPPPWNVWAGAAYAQKHGAPWLLPLSPQPTARAVAEKAPPPDRVAAAAQPHTVVAALQAHPTTQATKRSP